MTWPGLVRAWGAIVGGGVLLLVASACHSTPPDLLDPTPTVSTVAPAPQPTGEEFVIVDSGPREHATGEIVQDSATGQIVAYKVTDGDRASDIAARLGLTLPQLRALVGAQLEGISAGDTLWLAPS